MKNKEDQKYAVPAGLVSPGFKSVLDIGCKKKVLKNYLPKDIDYQGIDLFEGEEVIKHDLEKGIPFEDDSFDLVFALDILEHVDNIEFLLKEILRVTKKEAVIALPNMYFWLFRLRFLFFGRLSPHYDFYPEELGDRHKWLPSYYSSINFMELNTQGHNLQIFPRIYNHKRLVFFNIIDRTLANFFPNFFTSGAFFKIKMNKNKNMKLSAVYSIQPTKFSAVSSSNDWEGSLKFFKDLGYDGVELAIREPETVDVRRLKELTADLSLPVAAIGTGQVFIDEGLSFSDQDTKEKAIERFKKHIELAKELECPVIIGCIRGKNVNKENFIESLKIVGDFAKEKKVVLLIEPLNRYETSYLNKVSEVVDLIKEMGEPFRVLLDTFHMNIEEPDLIGTFKQAKDYIGHIHFADSNRLAPGSGHIDFSSVINYLKEINYKGFISAEVMPFPSQEKAAADSYNYIKSLIKKN